MPSMQRTDLNQEEKKGLFLAVLSYRLGNVTEACRFVGIGRQTYYDWTDQDKGFAAEVAIIQEEVKDFYESKGHQLASELDGAQIRYFLSHKARDRGYGKDSGPRVPSLPALNVYQQFNIGLPPRPKTLAEWEKQMIDAREQRLLTEGSPQEEVPGESLQESEVIEGELLNDSKTIEVSNNDTPAKAIDDSTPASQAESEGG